MKWLFSTLQLLVPDSGASVLDPVDRASDFNPSSLGLIKGKAMRRI